MAARDQATVALSQIAELAGVRPSAVSNWRKRFPDFPQPVTTAAGGRDLFPLDAVEEWLTRHGRLDADPAGERLLFDAMNIIRGRMTADEGAQAFAAAIALAAALPASSADVPNVQARIALVEQRNPKLRNVFTRLEELDRQTADQLMRLADSIEPDLRPEIFEAVLRRRSRFVETRTSDELAQLLATLVGAARSVLNPTAGEGTVLAAIGERNRAADLFGQEINQAAWRIAMQRFLLRGLEADLQLGDSLLDDRFPDLRADAVVCDPPFNTKNPLLNRDPAVAPWASFAATRARTADLLWVEHALAHLQPDGRAYILLAAGSLFRSGRDRDVRIELIRRGVVEAIVSLPAGSATHTSVQLALWVLRGAGSPNQPVLMVDATETSAQPRRGISSDDIEQIARALDGWQRTGAAAAETESLATATVPVVELLAGDADLTPRRWVQTLEAAPPEDRAQNAEAAIARFAAAHDRLARDRAAIHTLEDTQAAQWVSVRDLAAGEVADIVKGIRFRQDDCQPEGGVRVLRTRDIRETIVDEEPCFGNVDELRPRPVLTQPGDIILSPASGKLRAVVDEEGGHILASPLQALRFRADWMDPHVAAAFLESARNRRFAKGANWGYARVDLRDLELPVLPAEDAQRFRATLDALSAAERDARDLADQARAARESILNVVGDMGDPAWQ